MSKEGELRRIEDELTRRMKSERERLEQERKRLEDEFRSRLEDERNKLNQLRLVQEQEEQARRVAEEQARKQIEDELRARLEEEQKRLAEEQRENFERERQRIQDEAKQKAEEEIRRRIEEERIRSEEQRRQKEEEERVRQLSVEERRRIEEEETRKYEQAVREAIEEGRKLAQEKKFRSYVERGKELILQNKFEEALKEVTKIFLLNPSHEKGRLLERMIYAARQDYLRRDEETKRLQEEQQRKLELLQRRLEERARLDKEEEESKAIRSTKITEGLRRGNDYCTEGAYDKAQSEVETIYAIDPGNAEAQTLEMTILTAQERKKEAQAISQHRTLEGEAWKKEEENKEREVQEGRNLLKKESLTTFRCMVRDAWIGGKPGIDEQAMLEVVRHSLGLDEADRAIIEREVQREVFTEALRSAMKNGIIVDEDPVTKENLRTMYGVTSDEYDVIESRLLREINRELRSN
jgi:hypothetical protein